MSEATKDREKASKYPAGDVLNILYTHHARVHETFERVASSSGQERATAFEELKAMLKAHETAEEAVVRPFTAKAAGPDVAEARTEEEDEAEETLRALSKLDTDSDEFDQQFRELKKAVTDHAEAEEDDEFPALETCPPDERKELGERFLAEYRSAGGPQ